MVGLYCPSQRSAMLMGAGHGDVLLVPSWQGGGTWAVGGTATLFTTAVDATVGNPVGLSNGYFESPGSEHQEAYFPMADGSVPFWTADIDATTPTSVFPLLGSIRDGQVVNVPQ